MTHVALTVALCSHAIQQILPIDKKGNIFSAIQLIRNIATLIAFCFYFSNIIFSVYTSHLNYQHI